MPDTPAPTLWMIAIRDEIRAFMATDPSPYWATTESERDWYLKDHLHGRPIEDYAVVEVSGPVERAMEDERVRYGRVREELRQQRRQARESGRG